MNVRNIAKLANVSIATVSRVLNRPEVVLPETREHVLKIIKNSGYNPKTYGRSGIDGHSKLLVFLANSLDNYQTSRILQGATNVASKRNYMIMSCNIDNNSEREHMIIRHILNGGFDGVIFSKDVLESNTLEQLALRKIPFVFAGKYNSDPNQNMCYINFEEASYHMTRHLLGLGHKQIMFLNINNSNCYSEKSRRAGYLHAYREIGLPVPLEINFAVEDSIEGGKILSNIIMESKKTPDAIFAPNDEVATGIIQGFKKLGVDVPSDISVVGFSGSQISDIITPSLTTVEQPNYRLGIMAARMLFDLIDDDETNDQQSEVILQPKLKIGNSCTSKKQ